LDKNGFRHKYWYLNEWWYSIWYQLNLSLSLITQLIIRTKLYIYINCSVKLFFFFSQQLSIVCKWNLFTHQEFLLVHHSISTSALDPEEHEVLNSKPFFGWIYIKLISNFFFIMNPKNFSIKKHISKTCAWTW
jgi:hypothetical protein